MSRGVYFSTSVPGLRHSRRLCWQFYVEGHETRKRSWELEQYRRHARDPLASTIWRKADRRGQIRLHAPWPGGLQVAGDEAMLTLKRPRECE